MKQQKNIKKKINIMPALVIILLMIMVAGSIFLYIKNQETKKKGNNKISLEKVYQDKKFVFDDLEIIVSSKYNFLNTEKIKKQYEGKDIIEIPVQVKNTENTEHKFSISYVKIYDE